MEVGFCHLCRVFLAWDGGKGSLNTVQSLCAVVVCNGDAMC